jgi:hypothetical protein
MQDDLLYRFLYRCSACVLTCLVADVTGDGHPIGSEGLGARLG